MSTLLTCEDAFLDQNPFSLIASLSASKRKYQSIDFSLGVIAEGRFYLFSIVLVKSLTMTTIKRVENIETRVHFSFLLS